MKAEIEKRKLSSMKTGEAAKMPLKCETVSGNAVAIHFCAWQNTAALRRRVGVSIKTMLLAAAHCSGCSAKNRGGWTIATIAPAGSGGGSDHRSAAGGENLRTWHRWVWWMAWRFSISRGGTLRRVAQHNLSPG
jgi:hypothetical protein